VLEVVHDESAAVSREQAQVVQDAIRLTRGKGLVMGDDEKRLSCMTVKVARRSRRSSMALLRCVIECTEYRGAFAVSVRPARIAG
jgi:hypothetical protein